jgi:hypothetical protein
MGIGILEVYPVELVIYREENRGMEWNISIGESMGKCI